MNCNIKGLGAVTHVSLKSLAAYHLPSSADHSLTGLLIIASHYICTSDTNKYVPTLMEALTCHLKSISR